MAFRNRTATTADNHSTGASTTQRGATNASGGGVTVSTAPKSNSATTPRLTADIAADFGSEDSSNPVPNAPTSKLDLDITVNNFKPVDSAGFSEQRPELIAQFNLEPVFDENSINNQSRLNPVGEMIELQIASRKIRSENVLRLIDELKQDENAKNLIEELETKLSMFELETETEVKFLQELNQRLVDAKRCLSVKSNSSALREDIATRDSTISNDDPALDIIVNRLGFSHEGYGSFSDSKIIVQLLEDLRDIVNSYTPSLLDNIDPRRSNDRDPFEIRRVSNIDLVNVPFDASSLRSTRSSEIASILERGGTESFSDSFRSLSSADDKLKILFSILSKELRISSGLSSPVVRNTIRQTFGLDETQMDERVFDKIIGHASSNVFTTHIGGANSMLKLLTVNVDDAVVLPFEGAFIEHGGKRALPGHAFYVDSIIKGERKFETTAFQNYASSFGSAAQSLASIIEGMLDVDVINNDSLGLNASDMFDSFLRIIKRATTEIPTKTLGPSAFFTDNNPAASRDTFTPALLHAAADDPLLKHMLVLYVLHVGLRAATEPSAGHNIFKTLLVAGDLNQGTGQTIQNNPLAGVEAAIIGLLPDVRDNPTSVYGANQGASSGDDAATILWVGRSIRPGDANALANHGIDVISAAITARLLDLQASRSPPRSTTLGNENIDDVSEYRIFDKLSTVGAGDQAFLLKGIVDLINMLDRSARNSAGSKLTGSDYYSTTTPGLTRFNKLGAHTIVRMVIEAFTTFFKSFPVATFQGCDTVGSRGNKLFSVARDDALITELNDALMRLAPSTRIQQAPRRETTLSGLIVNEHNSRVQSIVDRVESIKKKFIQEDQTIKQITNIILAVGNLLKSESNAIKRFFDQTGPNASRLSGVLNAPGANFKLSALDNAQITLARNFLIEHKAGREAQSSEASTPFIDDTVISKHVRDSLFAMLKEPAFVAPGSNNVRILSVGLPSGFMNSLQHRLESFIEGQNFAEFSRRRNLQPNVIKIHVYMKDLLFDDVVFKPKTFIFETSRFIAAPDFKKITSNPTFENVLSNVSTRALAVDGSTFRTTTGYELANDSAYHAVITDDERRQMLENHVKSYLIRVYLRLLTGVDFNEDGFYLDDSIAELRVDLETLGVFKELLSSRVTQFAGRRLTFEQLRNINPDVKKLLNRIENIEGFSVTLSDIVKIVDDASKAVNIELSQDIQAFISVFGSNSILFGAGARAARVLAPKLFERIFHVVVDPDDFEIDSELTNVTRSGRSFMQSKLANRLIRELPVRHSLVRASAVGFDQAIRREFGSLSLQQFFVVVEQLPILTSLSQSRPTVPRGTNVTQSSPVNTPSGNSAQQATNTHLGSGLIQNDDDSSENEGFDWSSII